MADANESRDRRRKLGLAEDDTGGHPRYQRDGPEHPPGMAGERGEAPYPAQGPCQCSTHPAQPSID